MKKILLPLIVICFCTINSFSAVLNIPNNRPYISTNWTSALETTWSGIKSRNMGVWAGDLPSRPITSGLMEVTSQAVGFSLMIALYNNDQASFNKIWLKAEQIMWTNNHYMSSYPFNNGVDASAEIDIAAMLIFADYLVQTNYWSQVVQPQKITYKARAISMLKYIQNNLMLPMNRIAPWPGATMGVKLGNCSPAYYRIFDQFSKSNSIASNWLDFVDRCYTDLNAIPDFVVGLVPDFVSVPYLHLNGYGTFAEGGAMYKDGIQALFRIALDASWNNEPRASAFLRKSMDFLATKGGMTAANFFDKNGNTLSCDSLVSFDDGLTTRSRCEHSHLTVSMWAAAATIVGTDEEKAAANEEMHAWYMQGSDFFGRNYDVNNEDIMHNEMYLDQFLAWIGVSIMAGVNSNIIEDINNIPTASFLNNRHQQFIGDNKKSNSRMELIINEKYRTNLNGRLLLNSH